MDHTQDVGKREAIKKCPEFEGPRVSLADVFKDPQCLVHDCDVRKCVEATQGRCCRELLHPSIDHHPDTTGFDTAEEEIEAMYSNGGVGVDRCH